MKTKKLLIFLLVFLLLFTSCKTIGNPDTAGEKTPVLSGQPNPQNPVEDSENQLQSENQEQSEKPFPETPVFDIYEKVPQNSLHSGSVYLYNITADRLVYAKDETKGLPPASVLKIMTCLITLENVADLNRIVEVPQICFDEFESGDPNKDDIATAGIEPLQDNLTYLDCLYGLMTASGCEVSNVLAYNVGNRSISAFIDMMNAKAAELGCTDTNFTNPHGLFTPENNTSARDMFLITRYAYENYPLFKEIYEREIYYMPSNEKHPEGYTLRNRNALSVNSENNPYYTAFTKAIKIGSIDYFYEYKNGAWQVLSEGVTSLASCAVYKGEMYILVTIGAPYYFGPYTDDDGNQLRGLHYTYLDHKRLYEAVMQ
ncbi:MAG: hypothetical protein FWG44_03615 [Oscillospiraceae bacterium]|nr:hypothetical protein [Oscillospiraceae bacterium]